MIDREEFAELQREIIRNARMLDLAENNGFRCEVQELSHMPGRWWRVPELWVPMVGYQMARVA